MVKYQEFHLPNGLHLIVHEDHSSPVVCLNVLYQVGSRNEDPNRTGFAHLFEHLMFGGSKNVKTFDEPLQKVGGDNNAFTSPDITNYYITVPSANLETAFWLESDRMLSLSFDEEVLEVQRKVVIEEFKQRYLNQPYGDVWLKLRPEVYKQHPYQWPTIGKEISHIEEATMDDVKAFFKTHYQPGNAKLVVAGDIKAEEALALTEKWFGDIPGHKKEVVNLNPEPKQTAPRHLEIEENVPADAIYKVYHMPDRLGKEYHIADLLSDIIGRGHSSLLYNQLVKEKGLFSSLSAHVTGSYDPGLLVVTGKVSEGVSLESADLAIGQILETLGEDITDLQLQKVKNQSESATIFGEVDLLNRAMGLAYAAFLGDVNRINEEINLIREITLGEIKAMSQLILKPQNCTTLYYKAVANA